MKSSASIQKMPSGFISEDCGIDNNCWFRIMSIKAKVSHPKTESMSSDRAAETHLLILQLSLGVEIIVVERQHGSYYQHNSFLDD